MYGSNFWSVTRYPWPSSRQPIDAAASPLPSEDTTPPVTKMYLVVRPSIVSLVPPSGSSRTLLWRPASAGRRCREKAAHGRQILGCVHAQRVVWRLDGLDPDAVLEGAQLLQLFRPLQRRRVQPGQDEQHATAIRVKADMSVQGGPPAAGVP